MPTRSLKATCLITLLACGLSSASSVASEVDAYWVPTQVSLRYRLQDRSPWWGCHNASDHVRALLQLFEARNVDLQCWDNAGAGLPEVHLQLRFERLLLEASQESTQDKAQWWGVEFHSTLLCGFHAELLETLAPLFETRDRSSMSNCRGEEGQVYLRARTLVPVRDP